jgi:hypothetical protein
MRKPGVIVAGVMGSGEMSLFSSHFFRRQFPSTKPFMQRSQKEELDYVQICKEIQSQSRRRTWLVAVKYVRRAVCIEGAKPSAILGQLQPDQ